MADIDTGSDAGVAAKAFRLTLLRPGAGTSVTPGSRVNGIGWIVSDLHVSAIDVTLGGVPVGRARLNIEPGHLAALTGHHPAANETSFVFMATVPALPAGDAVLALAVATADGTRSHRIRLVVVAATSPAPESLVRAECEEALLTVAGRLVTKGWAICSSGVAGVRIELDGKAVGTVEPAEDRPDVGAQFGQIAGSRQSGFRFSAELGRRVEGQHTVRIVVLGRAGEEQAILRTVTAEAVPEAVPLPVDEPEQIRMFLDAPVCRDGAAVEPVRGFLSLTGWAFSTAAIDRIEVYVDGTLHGHAHHGIRREDLRNAFPDSDVLLAGFAMVIPPPVMKPGAHAVRVRVIDQTGRWREISFDVRAEKAYAGPGPWMLRRKIPAAETRLHRAMLAARGWAPRWAILIGQAEGREDALRTTLESLRWQTYQDWTVVLVADTPAQLRPLAAVTEDFAGVLAGRVRIVPGKPRRLLADLAADATAITVLTPGDRLGEDALLELSLAGALDPACDFAYSDERRIDPADGEEKAFFKPDFSPDLLLATNYIGRLWSASAALLRASGLREADLWQLGDYHAVLALTERAARIAHVPKVLCHAARRSDPGQRDRTALAAALRRRRVEAEILPGAIRGSYRVRRAVPAGGRVSIIIPTVASKGLIKTTIEAIRANTAWPDYEIVCIDNFPKTLTAEQRRWRAWIKANADTALALSQPFNWSLMNNVAAAKATGAFLLFLNDDVEVRDPHWLHGLTEHAQRPEVGVAGPQLLYPDGRVQHAGIFLGRRAGRHAFRYALPDEPGPFGLALTQREVISVTGACMMMRRDVFDRLGGFDEKHDVINNDVDFSLRVRRAGLSVVYTPAVSLIHHEMVSRGELGDSYNSAHFEREWGDLFRRGDPFFSRHYSPDYDDYAPEAEPVQVLTAGHPLVARGEIRRILAIKVDHIGDFVTAFPAFRRIKQHFPDAHLTVLAAKASLPLAALEPAIDAVIEFNLFHARSEKGRRALDARKLAKLAEQLAPERFDLALDLRRQAETRPILQASGARWLVGFEQGYAHPWLDISVEFEGDLATKYKNGHIAEALTGLVDTVSARCDGDRRIIAGAVDRAAGRAFAVSLLGDAASEHLAGRPLVFVHTGAGNGTKQWQADAFAGLINLLIDEAGACVAIIGAADELAFAGRVGRLVRRRERLFSLVGKSGLADLPLLLRAADLYVGNDSGPKHIAAAVGVPTVGVHSGTVDPGEWGAAGPFAVTVHRRVTCSPCYIGVVADCHRGMACLTGIAAGDVFDACRRMLALWVPEPEAPANPVSGGATVRRTP